MTNIPGVAQITAEENREHRDNVPTSHTLITDEGERALIALLSHQGHCVHQLFSRASLMNPAILFLSEMKPRVL